MKYPPSKNFCKLLTLVCFVPAAQAAVITLDFEGLTNLEPVNEFYNGGVGGNGSGPGTNYGISFSSDSLALIDADAGGSGNIGGEPSPDTAMIFLSGGAASMNVPAGFDTGFSFFYSAVNNPGAITVYDGENGTGSVIANLILPITLSDGGDPSGSFSPFVPFGVAFSGVAKSVDFGGTANQVAFDNITLGAALPIDPMSAIPEPTNVLTLAGLLCFGLSARCRNK